MVPKGRRRVLPALEKSGVHEHPDCVVLENKPSKQIAPNGTQKMRPPATPNEFLFHITAIYATGGMILAGDKYDWYL